ncbi:hypothetical protein HaLaN_17902 [Haematococcus lacustris]|uniref:Uncharacterized protein n=1 Tax=Haematococcus lacustris TaxID=44745 RepID=A0A699ZXN7_HAELA|nr:hypothetical protein HaLaN_17902 [Haematococcus lacustris]
MAGGPGRCPAGSPAVSVATVRNGSTAILAAPIPTEFLRLPVATPDTVDLRGGMHSVQVYVEPKGLAAPAAPAAAQLLVTALAIIEVKPLNLLSTSNTSSQTFTLVNITGKVRPAPVPFLSREP